MELMQRGVSYVVIALLAAHWANAASAYRPEGGSFDELFGRPLGEEEELPLLKATSPKISLIATTHGGGGGARSTEASGLGGTAVDATLLSTMVTEFLASTAQTPNKEEETESAAAAAAAAVESSHMSSEQPAAAATTTATTSAASTTTTPPLSSTGTPLAPAAASGDEAGKRRIITYDQRQEGQYNVRADLENFMIVLIPPTSVSDSLLDLLRKQQQRQSTLSALKRQKLKHHHHGGAPLDHDPDHDDVIGSGKYQHSSIKIGQGAAAAMGNYLSQQQQQHQQQQLPQPRPHYGAAASSYPLMPPLHVMHPSFAEAAGGGGTEAATDKLGAPADFIEGRTPYRVDISASDDEQSHLHLPERQQQQQQQLQQLQLQPTLHLGGHHAATAAEQTQHVVDVLPPPYTPLAYQHLMKPYLDADGTFPPSELKRSGGGHLTPATSGNFLETYSQLLNAGLVGGGVGVGGLGAEFGSLKSNAPHRGNSLAGSGISGRHGGYYRMARSILGYDGFKGNQLDGGRSAADAPNNPNYYPLYRSDLSLGAAQRYPPLDLPRIGNDAIASSGNNGEEQQLNAINGDAAAREGDQTMPMTDDEEGDVYDEELPQDDDLPPNAGYSYRELMEMGMDLQAKRLLERCSPGQRRDSYGLCRKIEGY